MTGAPQQQWHTQHGCWLLASLGVEHSPFLFFMATQRLLFLPTSNAPDHTIEKFPANERNHEAKTHFSCQLCNQGSTGKKIFELPCPRYFSFVTLQGSIQESLTSSASLSVNFWVRCSRLVTVGVRESSFSANLLAPLKQMFVSIKKVLCRVCMWQHLPKGPRQPVGNRESLWFVDCVFVKVSGLILWFSYCFIFTWYQSISFPSVCWTHALFEGRLGICAGFSKSENVSSLPSEQKSEHQSSKTDNNQSDQDGKSCSWGSGILPLAGPKLRICCCWSFVEREICRLRCCCE